MSEGVMSMQFWSRLQCGVDYLKAAAVAAGDDPAKVDALTPAAVIQQTPCFWVENGRLKVTYSNGSVVDVGPALGKGPAGEDVGPITGPTPKSHLVSLLRDLTPEDRLEVMRHFCSGCGDEQPEGRWCHCLNDE